MVRRKTKRKTKRKADDPIDTVLRYVSRTHGDTLSRVLFGTTEPILELRWIETQLASRQRRVDRAMSVRIGDKHHWQHIEWTEKLTADVCFRVYEYNHLLVMAAHADAKAASVPGQPPVQPASVDSVVVVLTGPREGFPASGFYRTSSANRIFSGVHFGIEAIYQRTVAEIASMGGVFWLVFVPLAIDADELEIVRTIETMKSRTNPDEFEALLATMFSMAKLKKDCPHFLDVIRSASGRPNMLFRNELTDIWTRQGRRIGRTEGRQEGRHALLRDLFERRLQRALTETETASFNAWWSKRGGPEEMSNAVIDLAASDLAALLARKRRTKSTRSAV